MKKIKIKHNNKWIVATSISVLAVVIVIGMNSMGWINIFPSGIDGENNMISYDGFILNGKAFFHNGDAMELDWEIQNYNDGVITNWRVWANLKDPNNDYHSATYYGTGAINMDEAVYVTTNFNDYFDIVGAWDIVAVTLEGDYLDETDVVIDRIDNEMLSVAYVLDLDITSYSITPSEITDGEQVTISYSVKNVGDTSSGVEVVVFSDLNANGVRDPGSERVILNDYVESLPVGQSLSDSVIRILNYDDFIDGVAHIVLYASAYVDSGPVQPDFHTSKTVMVTIQDAPPPQIDIEYNYTVLAVTAGSVSAIAVAILLLRKIFFKF